MKQDKQTENDARLFFDDILQKTNFIEKLRSVTREVRDKLSQFDPRKQRKSLTLVSTCLQLSCLLVWPALSPNTTYGCSGRPIATFF